MRVRGSPQVLRRRLLRYRRRGKRRIGSEVGELKFYLNIGRARLGSRPFLSFWR